MIRRQSRLLVLALVAAGCSSAPSTTTPVPSANAAPIAAADLRARLYAFADDSMRGRQAGTPDNIRATAWIAEQARRIGLQPGGENGSWFQDVPLVRRGLVAGAGLSVDGQPFTLWSDFAPIDRGAPSRAIEGASAIFAGRLADEATLVPASATVGKVVVVRARPGTPIFLAMSQVTQRYPQAVAIVFGNQDAIVRMAAQYFEEGQVSLKDDEPASTSAQPVLIIAGSRLTSALVGGSIDSLPPGKSGRSVRGTLSFAETTAPARNVVAILPGTDPTLKGQYVALGAHNDHIGVSHGKAFDHDSIRAYNQALHALGAVDPFDGSVDAARRAAIRVNVDSLHRIRPARMDSIYNGADDDGSGSVGLLELAEAWVNAQGADRPRRSVIFVWHTAEELGLYGSEWFTDHPTVPRDSIVAQVNIDMIGRGSAADVATGGPQYLELIGPRRLSTEYAQLIEAVNARRTTPFRIDYSLDADHHPENIYCRSDHANYARYGIPVAFFSTGQHSDYHQVSDEPQYIDYDHYASVVQFVYDIARTVANRDARLIVDRPKPDPKAPCVQ
ncbi:MAG TPA: M28 family peptidase [Gemmatimonadaceae bacterium]|nr:M28 family peptidase [Gemmatimonadaceae bacterium]